MSWLARFNRFPPCLCRFYAHDREKPLSHADIARRSGLSKSSVSDLSQRTTWDGVAMGRAFQFAQACGVDLLRPRRTISFMRQRKLAYLGNASGNARKMYDRMIRELVDLNQPSASA